MVQPRLPMLIDYLALNVYCSNDTRKGDWAKAHVKAQPAYGI